ncbi:MAG: V-type ATP synthase subunit E [Eubacteriales bacterium]
MSGLDNIIAEIAVQANGKADRILSEARQKAAEILEKGRAEREEWQHRLDETTEQECLDILTQAKSATRQERRRALLRARGQVIDEIIAEAKAKIESLPDTEYFDFLFRLFEKNAQPLDGLIRFAPADYAGIPGDFLARCRQVCPGSTLRLSGDMDTIRRGFVIEYGKVLQNCSIDAIFESERQRLRDTVNEVLTSDA